MVKCPKCGTELIRDPQSLQWYCPNCKNYVLFQDQTTKENEIEQIKKGVEEQADKRIKEAKKKKGLKRMLIAGSGIAGAAYVAHKYNQPQPPPPPQYPRRENHVMKYLMLLIVLGAIGFGLYTYGPMVWKNVKSALPPDFMSSSFMLYLSCVGDGIKGLATGKFDSMYACFETINKKPAETNVYEVLGTTTGYGENNELSIPYAKRSYEVLLELKNLFPEKPIHIKGVKGQLNYREKIQLEGRDEYVSDFVELVANRPGFDLYSESVISLKSKEELNCTVKDYDSILLEVSYSDYSTSRLSDYIIAKTKEHLEIAKKNTHVRDPGPIDITFDFNPKSYYPETDGDLEDLIIYIRFKNKVLNSEAIIKKFSIEKIDDENLLAFSKCICPNWGEEPIISDDNTITIPESSEMYATLTDNEHACECVYNIIKGKVRDLDAYKTITFDVTVEYDVTEKIERTDVPNVDQMFCAPTPQHLPEGT